MNTYKHYRSGRHATHDEALDERGCVRDGYSVHFDMMLMDSAKVTVAHAVAVTQAALNNRDSADLAYDEMIADMLNPPPLPLSRTPGAKTIGRGF